MKTESNAVAEHFDETPDLDWLAKGHLAFHLKRILVPVDFSKCSHKALRYAIPFAKQFQAELILLHVIPPVVVMQTPDMGSAQGLIQESAETARQNLEELRRALGDGIPTKGMVRTGSPHVEILDAAKDLDTDLIILSTHGRTGLSHILLGATAEKVVRRASCPVLIVREHEHEFVTVEEGAG